MQYKIEIIASILFSDSGCSWQQTHSLCVAMVSQRSWVHQNVPSNRSFTSSFLLSLSSALGTRSGAQNGKVDDQPWPRVQTRLPGQNLLDGRTSRLAAWRLSTCSKWRLPMLNFGLLSHWSQKKDWIEQPIVLAPTKLKPAAQSCWDHFRAKAYFMPWVK